MSIIVILLLITT